MAGFKYAGIPETLEARTTNQTETSAEKDDDKIMPHLSVPHNHGETKLKLVLGVDRRQPPEKSPQLSLVGVPECWHPRQQKWAIQ